MTPRFEIAAETLNTEVVFLFRNLSHLGRTSQYVRPVVGKKVELVDKESKLRS